MQEVENMILVGWYSGHFWFYMYNEKSVIAVEAKTLIFVDMYENTL